VLLGASTLQPLLRRTDGRVVVDWGGIGTETLDGVALLGEALVVIGVENRTPPRPYLVGDEVEVWDGEGTGIETVTMNTGGYHRLEGVVILPLPLLPDVVGVGGTARELGEGRETRDPVAHPVDLPGTIERAVNPQAHEQGITRFIGVEYTAIFDL